MSGESSFWCRSFSRFWWWLLALLGLPLLFFFMTQYAQKPIEADLTSRVSEALAAEGIDWVEVDVNQRGRDVLLKGMAGSDADRNKAIAVAQGVYGVNRVDYEGDMDVGAGDQAQVADNDAGQNIAEIDAAKEEDTSGRAGSAETEIAEEEEASGKTGSAETEVAEITDAKESSLLPAELKMSMQGDQLVLDGTMASQSEVDALQQAATLQLGVTRVVNNLTVSDKYAGAGWIKGVGDMMGGLPAGSKVVVKGDTLELSGEVDSEDARATLSSQVGTALQGSGLQLLNALKIVVPDSGEAEQQVTAETEKKRVACQEDLNAAMQGKNILFTFNKADISARSYSLLDNLGKIISECGDKLKGVSILIGGHTDSVGNDAYNLDLSQRRADAVSAYLKSKGIDADMLEAKGFGESRPVASNRTKAGQAKNRRITFEIKRK